MIRKFLDLSTGHLCEDTREQLHKNPAMMQNEYGFFIAIPSVQLARRDVPDDLEEIRDLARALGCDYVHFDRDADRLPGLPYYDD